MRIMRITAKSIRRSVKTEAYYIRIKREEMRDTEVIDYLMLS